MTTLAEQKRKELNVTKADVERLRGSLQGILDEIDYLLVSIPETQLVQDDEYRKVATFERYCKQWKNELKWEYLK